MSLKIAFLEKRAVIACIVIVIAAIFLIRPFFGPMDDASHLFNLIPKAKSSGFLSMAIDYEKNVDLPKGFFRPLYLPMIYLYYAPAAKLGPLYLFLVNAISVILVVGFLIRVLSRITQTDPWLAATFLFGFPYAHDLFTYPSLQEKIVLIFGAALLSVVTKPKLSRIKRLSFSFLFLTLGAFSKASFAIYGVISVIAYLGAQPGSRTRRQQLEEAVVLTIFLGINVGWTALLARQGSYTSAFSGNKAVPNLISRLGIIFTGFTLLSFASAIRLSWKSRKISWNDFIPSVGTAAFLAIFLPWALGSYLQTIIDPVIAVGLALLVKNDLNRFQPFISRAALVIAVLMTSMRSYSGFQRLHDMGKIVAAAETIRASGIETLYAPCDEGAGSLKLYVREIGKSRLNVLQLKNMSSLDGKTLFFDQSLCPLPERADGISNCTQEVIIRPTFSKSYRVARFHCKPS